MNKKPIINQYSNALEEIAKEEYVSARILYLNFSLRSARTLAHQTIEKLFKAVCLRNKLKIPDYGHNIIDLNEHIKQFIDLKIPPDGHSFISELADDYSHARYATRPININRSEIWLMDKVVLSLLRFCHGIVNRETGRTIRATNPLKKHFKFPDFKTADSFEKEMLDFLTAETIFSSNKTVDEIKNNFIEFSTSNNTFWDSLPNTERSSVYAVLDEYIGGFNRLQKNPDVYNGRKVASMGVKVDGAIETVFFKPLSMTTRHMGAINTPPDELFYK